MDSPELLGATLRVLVWLEQLGAQFPHRSTQLLAPDSQHITVLAEFTQVSHTLHELLLMLQNVLLNGCFDNSQLLCQLRYHDFNP
jgi:hypothetical protein